VACLQAMLELAQQEVVGEVGEERQVVQRVVEGGQQVGVVRLQHCPSTCGGMSASGRSHSMAMLNQRRHSAPARRHGSHGRWLKLRGVWGGAQSRSGFNNLDYFIVINFKS
jgi:hypothetical protein